MFFVHTVLSSFIRRDLEILEKHFDVRRASIETFLVPRKNKNPLEFFRLFKGILWTDVAFTWFADVNAFFMTFLCKFLRKKSLIVVGGYDVIYVPKIDYGDLKSNFARVRTKLVLEHATRILPFSYYAKDKVLDITRKADLRVIQLACDTDRFKPSEENKENLVITVCYVDKSNVKRKGLKTFVGSAKFLPHLKFALIGAHADDSVDYLKGISAPNVEFPGYVTDAELLKWYQRAKVYCQLSYEEGFGVAVVEAMACECVPVAGKEAKVLKETVGYCGFYVPYGDVEATAEAVEKAASVSQEVRTAARQRAKALFSIGRREKELLNLINDVVGVHG